MIPEYMTDTFKSLLTAVVDGVSRTTDLVWEWDHPFREGGALRTTRRHLLTMKKEGLIDNGSRDLNGWNWRPTRDGTELLRLWMETEEDEIEPDRPE